MLIAAGCSAIDNFGRFTVDGGVTAGCTPGCTCVAGTPSLGVPDHCAVAPLGALSCAGLTRNGDVVMLAQGSYTLDSGASPPALLDGTGGRVITGNVSGATALFCIGSLVANGGARISITGSRPVAILADSLISIGSGGISLGGEYAIDVNGGRGVAGGSDGGASGNNAAGTGGGHAGGGSPGAGGSGGGSAQAGGLGGPGGGSSTFTTSGSGSMTPTVGFGGGGGGKGSSNGGGGGGGAGALQLSASYAINFDSVEIDASGGGGAGGAAPMLAGAASGGGGGGGGGVIVIDAPTVTITGGCISVIGGPGGAGAGAVRGGDARPNPACGFSGAGGIAPPSGGAGGAASMQQPNGGSGSGSGGGGGGIGGFGRVTLRAQNAPPQTQPPGVVPASAYFPMTLP